jgi:predicted nucleic acid-binding protein
MQVIDASVMVRVFWRPVASAVAVYTSLLHKPDAFAVPELFLFETNAVLARILPNGTRTFSEMVLPVIESGVHRVVMTKDLCQAVQKYIGLGLTGYDACYAGLADELDAKWLTFDAKAHSRIEKAGVSELLKD